VSDYPPPDASAVQVAQWKAEQEKRARSRRVSEANRSANRACSSCGRRGHVRGNACCPNYDSPWRWLDHGAVWKHEE
jgi:hypothetical protein